jgi:hypothetical protein
MNISYLGLPNLLAEEAVGAEQEEDEKNEKGNSVLPLRGYLPDPEVLRKGDEKAAERTKSSEFLSVKGGAKKASEVTAAKIWIVGGKIFDEHSHYRSRSVIKS